MIKWEKIDLLSEVAFKVNHLADSPDKYKATEKEIRDGIKNKTLFQFLHEQRNAEPHLINDFSHYTEEQLDYLYEALGEAEGCHPKEEDCCVKNNNYNFLLALVLMCMQGEISE